MIETPEILDLSQEVRERRALMLSHLAQLRSRLDPRRTIRTHPRAAVATAFAVGFTLGWLRSRRQAHRSIVWLP